MPASYGEFLAPDRDRATQLAQPNAAQFLEPSELALQQVRLEPHILPCHPCVTVLKDVCASR